MKMYYNGNIIVFLCKNQNSFFKIAKLINLAKNIKKNPRFRLEYAPQK